MVFEENSIYHIYNRGNNQQRIFFDDENYSFFLRKIEKELSPYCKILVYCLMPNHFHLMVYVLKEGCESTTRPTTLSGRMSVGMESGRMSVGMESGRMSVGVESGRTSVGGGMQILTRKIGTLLSSYTRAINKQHHRTGSLFQQKTKAKCLLNHDAHYPNICFHYIHQNPLKAGLVPKMEDWEFSSFKDYVGLRKGNLTAVESCKELMEIPSSPKEIYHESYDIIADDKINKLY